MSFLPFLLDSLDRDRARLVRRLVLETDLGDRDRLGLLPLDELLLLLSLRLRFLTPFAPLRFMDFLEEACLGLLEDLRSFRKLALVPREDNEPLL